MVIPVVLKIEINMLNNHSLNEFPSVTSQAQLKRREEYWQAMCKALPQLVDENGRGRIPQFQSPCREVVWCLPALFNGEAAHIQLANRMIARFNDVEGSTLCPSRHAMKGKCFDIFHTNTLCELYFDYHELMSPQAREVAMWHVRQVPQTFHGSAQPDFVFRGCNDNMPAMATCGLVMAGQILGDKNALEHARWNLLQLRQILSRSAWMGEYNSPTYSAVTLRSMAKIASVAQDPEIRELALKIEHRIWAEILLHFHPGTLQQAGPMSRSYSVNRAGHNYNLQSILWYILGEELTGRNLVRSFFEPDGTEVIHFKGCPYQSAAEFCHLMNTPMHLPQSLRFLTQTRSYPAVLRGRSEQSRSCYAGAQVQTQTYMQPDYSLGTVNYPFVNAHQTCAVHLTYARCKPVTSFRDGGTAFTCYRTDDLPYGQMETSDDGGYQGECMTPNKSWYYATQKENVALMLCTPSLTENHDVSMLKTLNTDTLKLQLVFSAHFGRIEECCFDDEADTRAHASEQVSAVSLRAGEVFIHVQPLIPTQMLRQHAVRLTRQNAYDVLELVNYEGPVKAFSCMDLQRVLNGLVLTVEDSSKYESLEAFHNQFAKARVVDYLFVGTRYMEYLRNDCWFRVVMSTNSPGVVTEMIDGLPCPKPVFESNQLDVSQMPFLGERCKPTDPFFPWDQMEIHNWRNSWMIGSRGLPGETPYGNRTFKFYPVEDGPA